MMGKEGQRRSEREAIWVSELESKPIYLWSGAKKRFLNISRMQDTKVMRPKFLKQHAPDMQIRQCLKYCSKRASP